MTDEPETCLQKKSGTNFYFKKNNPSGLVMYELLLKKCHHLL